MVDMFGLGKKRSKFGEYLDRRNITQLWLSNESKVNRNTISELCDGSKKLEPNEKTITRIVSALRKHGHDVRAEDFWG